MESLFGTKFTMPLCHEKNVFKRSSVVFKSHKRPLELSKKFITTILNLTMFTFNSLIFKATVQSRSTNQLKIQFDTWTPFLLTCQGLETWLYISLSKFINGDLKCSRRLIDALNIGLFTFCTMDRISTAFYRKISGLYGLLSWPIISCFRIRMILCSLEIS